MIIENDTIRLEGTHEEYTIPVICAYLTLAYDEAGKDESNSIKRLSRAAEIATIIMSGLEFKQPMIDGHLCNRTLWVRDERGGRIHLHVAKNEFRYSELYDRSTPMVANPMPAFMIGHPVELD